MTQEERKNQREGSFAEFMANSPLAASGIEIFRHEEPTLRTMIRRYRRAVARIWRT
ncbi:hypothetical protein ACFVMC_21260 [Nocardia sp. NPDC127579]|uniref:hypothetical protein n=1 Tax=Nocardia sp. NPDC127579 TaxID=3345402 RepID=UPI0036459728